MSSLRIVVDVRAGRVQGRGRAVEAASAACERGGGLTRILDRFGATPESARSREQRSRDDRYRRDDVVDACRERRLGQVCSDQQIAVARDVARIYRHRCILRFSLLSAAAATYD